VETIERKGIGHPDTISDALAEAFSLALSRFYLEHFGAILHHNVDKVLLWGGAASPSFAGGQVDAPIEIFLSGRAVTRWQGVEVPVEALARESCSAWLREHMRFIDADRDIRLHSLVRPGSVDLEELFQREGQAPLANDTSCGVGFAPLSELERIVHDAERTLNGAAFKAGHPEAGEDIKVMGVRDGDAIRLTIGCAFVGWHLPDMDAYLQAKAAVAGAESGAATLTKRHVTVDVNTADDGEAERGDRANGLITPDRPMTMGSVVGKNPVTHVGKLYNVAAGLLAQAIVTELDEIPAVECALVSQIGKPQICDIQICGIESPLPEHLRRSNSR